MRCMARSLNSFHHINSLFLQIFGGAKNWIFLKKDLSLEIVLGKTAGKPRSGRINTNRNVDRNAYRKINERLLIRNLSLWK